MKKCFFLLLCTTILLYCKNSNTTNSDVNIGTKPVEFPYFLNIEESLDKPKTFLLSRIGQEIEYIPLETTANNPMREIGRIVFTKDFIFLSASSKVFKFDRKGKFIGKIGTNGRGPGEYTQLADFCIDQKNEKIFILAGGSSKNNVLEYNFNGEFISSSILDWYTGQIFVHDTLGLVFYIGDDRNSSIHSKWNLYITDFKCTPLFKISRYSTRESNLDATKVPMYIFNEVLHYKQYAVDTSYILKNNKPEPYAIFNLGQRKLDPNLMFAGSNQNISEMMKEIEDDIEIREISENEHYLFVRLALGLTDSSFHYIFHKQTSETAILDNNGFKNDLDGGKSFWPKYIYNNENILVDYSNAFELLNYMRNINSKELREKFGEKYDRLEKIVNELDEMSNPVLIILR